MHMRICIHTYTSHVTENNLIQEQIPIALLDESFAMASGFQGSCLHICTYIHTCIHTCTSHMTKGSPLSDPHSCTYIHTCMQTYIYSLYTGMTDDRSTYAHAYMHTYIYKPYDCRQSTKRSEEMRSPPCAPKISISTYACMHVCMYVCMCVCISDLKKCARRPAHQK
jgi:hypothetical protein